MPRSSKKHTPASRPGTGSGRPSVRATNINRFTSNTIPSPFKSDITVMDLTNDNSTTTSNGWEDDYTSLQNAWILKFGERAWQKKIPWNQCAQKYQETFQQTRSISSLQRQLESLRKKEWRRRYSPPSRSSPWSEEEMSWLREYCENHRDEKLTIYWATCSACFSERFTTVRSISSLRAKWWRLMHGYERIQGRTVSGISRGVQNGQCGSDKWQLEEVSQAIGNEENTLWDISPNKPSFREAKRLQGEEGDDIWFLQSTESGKSSSGGSPYGQVQTTKEENWEITAEQEVWILKNGGGMTRGKMPWLDCAEEFNRIFEKNRDMGDILCEWYRLLRPSQLKL